MSSVSPNGFYYDIAVTTGYARTWSSFTSSNSYASLAQTNASLAIAQLVSYGFTVASACGVVGMIMEESAINPGNKQGASTSLGWGFIQWTPSTSLTSYVSDPWYYGEVQLYVVNEEVMGNSPFNGRFFPSTTHPEYSYTGAQFKALTDPVEAATAYLWERGRGAASVMARAIEIATDNAYNLMEWYTEQPVPTPSPPTPSTPIEPSPPQPPFSYYQKVAKKRDRYRHRRRQ